MTTESDFDALTIKTIESNGAMEDLSNLYGAAFALSEWLFIARGELPNVSPYIASNAQYADGQPMIRAFTDAKRLIRFAQENNLTKTDGTCDSLSIPTKSIIDYLEQFIASGAYGIWFNSDSQSEGFFVPLEQLRPIKEHLEKTSWKNNTADSPPAPIESISDLDATADILLPTEDNPAERSSNLENWGLSPTPDGEVDLNLSINKVGSVNFDTSIAPFYQAIVPLLENYQGSGEYNKLLAFDPNGMSELVENIADNTHGAYLRIRRFLYVNPKNNVRIGVNSIHSNQMRHVQSNGTLLVSFELCKNLDNQTAAFYFAFLGARSEITKLINAIQPILDQCGYKSVSQ